jgi:FAD-dependent urate hydroxylase
MDASARDGGVRLLLDDGSERHADHVLLGTGYRVDVEGYDFLAPELVQGVRRVGGYPVLRPGLESTVAGLHFLGAPASWSFGPIMRFISGSWYATAAVSETIRARRRRMPKR